MGGERYRVLFEQLSDLGFERGKDVRSITVGVLMILRAYKDRKKLEALAKLTGKEEGFGDYALHLEARRRVLGEEHRGTLSSLVCMGTLHGQTLKDY